MSDVTDGSVPIALLAVGETLRISAPTMLEALFGRVRRETCNERLAAWSSRVVREAAIDLEVRGLEHAHGGEPLVLMSNHQSHYDVPVLFRAFPGCLRMVAKTELYRIPVFGRALRAAEFVEVDRGNSARARASIESAKQLLRSGVNVWIAPEGTRSRTGALGEFKKGGFILALDTGAKILPITIDGTRNVLPSHSAKVRRGRKVTVIFHPRIDPAPYGKEHREALVAEVRARIGAALP